MSVEAGGGLEHFDMICQVTQCPADIIQLVLFILLYNGPAMAHLRSLAHAFEFRIKDAWLVEVGTALTGLGDVR